MRTNFDWKPLKKRDHLEGLRVNGRKIIQFILKNIKCGCEIGSSDSRDRSLVSCFGRINKFKDFITSRVLGSNMELNLI